MKTQFLLQKANNRNLVLIFAGWSTGPELFKPLEETIPEGWDLLVAYDYSDFTFPNEILDRYYTVYLFAWSLGIAASARSLAPEKITRAFAINGTLEPVSDNYGIPPAIFNGTADRLDTRNLAKFRQRMFASGDEFRSKSHLFSQEDDIESLRKQLYLFSQPLQTVGLPWKRVFIGRDDRIFPPVNQKRFWETQEATEIIELEKPHYIDMAQIMPFLVNDIRNVGESFQAALPSYDSHAIAQKEIASKLDWYIRQHHTGKISDVIEIGAGSGMLTREYARSLSPDKITFIELYDVEPYNLAPDERYIVTDAEEWFEEEGEPADAIFSSCAIQWFTNPEKFFRNAAKRLRKDGILAIATFLPDNLPELNEMNPNRLVYPSREELELWLGRYFDNVWLYEQPVKVEFESTREALMNLRKTGASPRRKGDKAQSRKSADLTIRSLTFKPVYIIATVFENK